jgi:hypothetical protein
MTKPIRALLEGLEWVYIWEIEDRGFIRRHPASYFRF